MSSSAAEGEPSGRLRGKSASSPDATGAIPASSRRARGLRRSRARRSPRPGRQCRRCSRDESRGPGPPPLRGVASLVHMRNERRFPHGLHADDREPTPPAEEEHRRGRSRRDPRARCRRNEQPFAIEQVVRLLSHRVPSAIGGIMVLEFCEKAGGAAPRAACAREPGRAVARDHRRTRQPRATTSRLRHGPAVGAACRLSPPSRGRSPRDTRARSSHPSSPGATPRPCLLEFSRRLLPPLPRGGSPPRVRRHRGRRGARSPLEPLHGRRRRR